MDTPDEDLALPADLRGERFDRDAAERLLTQLAHHSPGPWLKRKLASAVLEMSGTPPLLAAGDLWRELLRDECDKLYNQAWCALEQILDADDDEQVLLLAMDDLPSAVEQAFSLAPPFAKEHLALLEKHKPERHADILGELDVGGEGETDERIECLDFWEENAPDLSDLRRNLFMLVRAELTRRGGGG